MYPEGPISVLCVYTEDPIPWSTAVHRQTADRSHGSGIASGRGEVWTQEVGGTQVPPSHPELSGSTLRPFYVHCTYISTILTYISAFF